MAGPSIQCGMYGRCPRQLPLWIALAALTACVPAEEDGTSDGVTETVCAAPAGTCASEVCQHPNEGALHETPCASLSFEQNPPTSGTHYSTWASFKTYDAPISRGFWVHSMEHGAVVLAYNCDVYDGDCDALAATLAQFRADWTQDSKCSEAVRNRIIVTPDPLLDVPFAAAAWDWSLKATCFDEAAVGAFIEAHYAQTVEDFCADGVDPLNPDPGFPYPTDCP